MGGRYLQSGSVKGSTIPNEGMDLGARSEFHMEQGVWLARPVRPDVRQPISSLSEDHLLYSAKAISYQSNFITQKPEPSI